MSQKHEKKYGKGEKADNAMQLFQSMFSREAFDEYKTTIECSNYTYKVADTQVKGFAIKPKEAKGKLPVLIYNRGGNGNFGGVVFGHMMSKLFPLANQQFIIIGSQYRGTFQRNSIAGDEFGGDDVQDVVALSKLIPHLVNGNQNKIGMYGASRGGMQTFLSMKYIPEVKAIAVISGVSNLLTDLEIRPNMEKVYKKRIPNYDTEKESQLKARSVMYWLDELDQRKPILLIHGEKDERVHVRNAKQLAAALKERKRPHKLLIYPEGTHSLMEEGQQITSELANWFNQNL
ncbi:prolyl oligopeptidase family serine peptidase [Paraneptunicella aestuarii]|uniref:alpha/beta hydrolase family protein n=1 Tax=Paraneptunicella aestuarii TaxID=2831148 RepID=UPI001E38CE92|nr:prolyl oligopeptidase family serine peptidase [Paraneptunicella aestuarii]UAA39074.1 prolyl oligopeptidase family serine peptidase [Paraneptunicella aestuarii]